MADSHTGNHPEDDFTPLETIRRLCSVFGRRSHLGFEGETSELKGRFVIASQTCSLMKEQLTQFIQDFDIPQDVKIILPKSSQIIFNAPLGYAGLYTHHFSLSNLRLPIPSFICKVLNYFKVHNSRFNPFGMVKLTTFAVMCRAYGGEPTVNLLHSFLNLGHAGDWLTLSNREMDFRSFMMQEIDGEFKFLPEGCIDDDQCSPSSKSVNKEALVIDARTLTSVHPSDFVEDVADSDDASAGDNENPLLGTSFPSLPEAGKKLRSLGKRKLPSGVRDSLPKVQKMAAQASKVAGEASDPLGVDSDVDIHEFPSTKELKDSADCHWVVAHVTPPSWKEHLRQISIKQLCDIRDRAYMHQVVLDNVLNSRTWELISALHKATASYDAIRSRELEKDKSYAELERKCNEALLDLNKNPLVADMRTEIKTLQRRVDERLKLSEIQLLREMDALKQDRASFVAKVVPDAATKLIRSDEMGMLVAKLVMASILDGRCSAYEEVANLKEAFLSWRRWASLSSSSNACKKVTTYAGDHLARMRRVNEARGAKDTLGILFWGVMHKRFGVITSWDICYDLKSCYFNVEQFKPLDDVKIIQDYTQCQEQSMATKVSGKDAIVAGTTWPFSHWGVNILGPLPRATGSLKFLAIAVEHSTKWVEAKPLTMTNRRKAEKFAWEHIV
ncbi:putative ribonuclease H-like domain-containing protein [Tanacetum coccineum]